MYPAVAGVGGVVLETPMFRKAVVRFGDGRALIINGLDTGFYVRKVSLNRISFSEQLVAT
jgi:hypothetical protein